jgi:hypothetical protein
MPMKFLTLPVIIFKPVGSGKRIFYAESKHDDNLYARKFKVNDLSLRCVHPATRKLKLRMK